MIFFTTHVMPYINLSLTLFVGIILWNIIKQKNAQIETLLTQFKSAKDLLEMYDINQLKQYTELKVENVKEEYKQKLSKSDSDIKDILSDLSKPWIEKYNELVDVELHYLLNISKERREQFLNLLPKNKEFLNELIKQIELGNLRPS